MEILQPHEYWLIKQQAFELIKAYHSVNDKQTIEALQTLIKGEIETYFKRAPKLNPYLDKLMVQTLTKEQFLVIFEALKVFVQPMKIPSHKQIQKCFRKVKKLPNLETESIDFRELSYLGFNDGNNNRKYLIRNVNQQFIGLYGQFSPDAQKGHCAICNHISTVAFFLATTKSAGDGTYTKKGNYLCTDSFECNRHISQLEHLEKFWQNFSN
ncbi:FusB/FusC family EF-G-binding protein [Enterococcus sp. MMGLQ5-2]|nr:FusB/FusC family EF-G-binding protein [Enterococcus sp. MMGLQ5-1]NPD36088.1 FusB/FusC family EF-G-binding protein [Enterococcus sp. MMGLQ5-2]